MHSVRAAGRPRGGASPSGGGAGPTALPGGRCARRARADPAPAAEPLWVRQAPGVARRKDPLRARWAGLGWSGFSEGPAGRGIEAAGRGGPLRESLLLGLGMECGRVSVKGFVTGSLLPSPRLVFKRERRQTENVLPSRPHGLSSVDPGRQCGGGPAILGRKTDLPLYQQICLHVSLGYGLDLSSPGALLCPPRCWVEGLRCFDLSASGLEEHVAEKIAITVFGQRLF